MIQTSQMTFIQPKNKQIKITSTLTRHLMYCRDGACPVRAYPCPVRAYPCPVRATPSHSVLALTPCAICSSGEERRIGLRVSSFFLPCHPSLRSASRCPSRQILRCAQDDMRVLSIPSLPLHLAPTPSSILATTSCC